MTALAWRRWMRWAAWASLAGVAALVAAVALVGDVRWRAQVLMLTASGRVDDLTLREVFPMLLPHSGYWLKELADTRSPYATIANPYASDADVRAGGEIFARECAGCHGATARGGPAAPAIVGRNLKHGDSDWALFRVIQRGVTGTAMPPHTWATSRLWRVVAYLRSINVNFSGKAITDPTTGERLASVTALRAEELASARFPSSDWLTYSGAYSGTRHSALTQVDRGNVARLAPRWIHQFEGVAERIETSPIVRDGVMFVTYGSKVAALDARDGATLWEFSRPLPADTRTCCGLVNRGVALLGDTVFVATADAHLIALAARTGAKLWDTAVVPDHRPGYAITSAPLVIEGLVITGIAGGDFPTRGFIAAFDVATGKERWRFRTIPDPGEPGSDTWAGESWRKGGGATWLTGSYDPATDTLYWGVGNPAPDFNGRGRAGDNLYTCSVVALQGKTGKLLWHFQFTPGDDHDWDSAQIPVIADRADSAPSHQLLWANRNGFFYVLDRTTGRFIRGAPYVQVTWAAGLDAAGRPKRVPEAVPTKQGILLYPSASGATNWWSPSYDPDLDLMLVPTLDRGGMFFAADDWDAKEGEQYLGGRAGAVEDLPAATAVTAIDPKTGAVVWRHRREGHTIEDLNLGGLMTTASGLTFTSSDRDFYALDTRTGQELWRFHAGGRIAAAPVSYLVEGVQQVAVTAGRALIAFSVVAPGATSPAASMTAPAAATQARARKH